MSTHPKWKYAVGKSVMVQDEAEELALEGEWFDFPEQLKNSLIHKARTIDENLAEKRRGKLEEMRLDSDIAKLKAELGEEDEPLPEVEDEPSAQPDIETLRATASALGVKYDGRTGPSKLSALIKAAIEEKGE